MDRGAFPSTEIRCEIIHNVEDFSKIAIYRGDPQSEGTQIHEFISTEFFGFITGEIVRGKFLLFSDDNDQDENEFFAGNWFVFISSRACPNGALRGQLGSNYNIAALLRGFNEIPPISSPHQGILLGQYNLDPASKAINYEIQHTIPGDFDFTFNQGRAGTLGEPIAGGSYLSGQDRFNLTGTLDSSLQDALYSKGLYTNIFTENFPEGEIRDQIHIVDAIPPINYAFSLDPTQSNDFLGSALFNINCATGAVEYMVVHNLANPVNASIMLNDGVLSKLNGKISPIFGNFTLSVGLVEQLIQGNLFIQIDNFSGGSVRGKIDQQFPLYAYISGSQEVPSVTSPAKGIALLSVSGSTLSYRVQFENISPTAAHFHFGVAGVKGDILITFDSLVSPVVGSASLSSNQRNELFSGQWYVNLHSTAFSSGESRGQVIPSFSVCAFASENSITPSTDDYVPNDTASSALQILSCTTVCTLVAALLL